MNLICFHKDGFLIDHLILMVFFRRNPIETIFDSIFLDCEHEMEYELGK